MSCCVGLRGSLDPVLLWLWPRPAVAALIQPRAWELSHAAGAALKSRKEKKRKNKKWKTFCIDPTCPLWVTVSRWVWAEVWAGVTLQPNYESFCWNSPFSSGRREGSLLVIGRGEPHLQCPQSWAPPGITLSEISQREKDKCWMISVICEISKIQQTSEDNKKEADSQI